MPCGAWWLGQLGGRRKDRGERGAAHVAGEVKHGGSMSGQQLAQLGARGVGILLEQRRHVTQTFLRNFRPQISENVPKRISEIRHESFRLGI